jgi:hypothetical protein
MKLFSKIFLNIILFFSMSFYFMTHSLAEEKPTEIKAAPSQTPEVATENYGPELKALKKWAVFPFDVVDEKLKQAADQAWWKVREKITEKKRFQVASKQFLIQRDVFQPRKNLNAEDIKFLAQHLDADVIITGFSEYRDIQLNAYLTQTGQLLWSKKIGFHPSLRASEQLLNLSTRLITEFIEKIPYQGTLIEEDEKRPEIFYVDLGINENVSPGDEITFLKSILPDSEKEKTKTENILAFMQTVVVSQGKVLSVKKNFIAVEVKKEEIEKTKHTSLIGYPKEKKLAAYEDKLAPELVPTAEDDVGREGSHSKNTVIFGSVFSFLGLLLLAF